MLYQFKFPDIGEGVSEGEVVKVLVKVGDSVKEEQPLVEVMTDKVNVQIPSPVSGRILSVLTREGDSVKVGQTLLEIEAEGMPPQKVEKEGRDSSEIKLPPHLTGTPPVTAETVIATPAVRKLAKELGVELSTVRGRGPGGRVTEEDVRAASGSRSTQVTSVSKEIEEVIPLRGIRKTVAEHMVKSKETAAAVTHVDEVDVTELVALREAFKGSAEKRGVKLTYLPFVIKAVVAALREFPYLNASVDDQAGSIILKKYYNMGVATDTEQGLVVPVLRDVDRKDLYQLASEIETLAEKARAGKLSLDEVRGGTFSITNVGSIGGLFATPIINWPEVAVLGLHKIARRPVIREGEVVARDITYLSLTFDHRVADGAYAARFLNRVIEILQDPKKLLSEVL
jgi:2-oxoglutarate dehydrogenase complex dihydrolipoamide succinyltransferase (E2) component